MNLLAKRKKGQEYLIEDFIATRLNEKQFKRIQQQNMGVLGDYTFIPYNETDFSWWSRVNKKLTPKTLTKNVYFDCDFHGKITEY